MKVLMCVLQRGIARHLPIWRKRIGDCSCRPEVFSIMPYSDGTSVEFWFHESLDESMNR